MYNKTIIVGHLTRNIEIKYTQSGMAIGNSAIASSRKFKSQTGEQKEETLFVDIAFFGRTAEIANQYLRKGSKVLVEGKLKLDQWTAPDGMKRSKHSISVDNMTMLDNKGTNPSDTPMGNGGTYGQENPPAQNNYNQNQAPQQNQNQNQAPQNNYGQSQQNNYNQPEQNSYAQPQQNNYNQASSNSVPQQQPTHTLPSIDINEDEIPF